MDRREIDAVVGANVRGRRGGLGMSQPDLADKMVRLGHDGWSAPTVSRVESGKRATSTAELLGLGLVLGATTEDLLDPTVYGDESDLDMGMAVLARDLRAIVRGEYRPRLTFGKTVTYTLVPTDRVDVVVRAATVEAKAHIHTAAVQTEPPEGDQR